MVFQRNFWRKLSRFIVAKLCCVVDMLAYCFHPNRKRQFVNVFRRNQTIKPRKKYVCSVRSNSQWLQVTIVNSWGHNVSCCVLVEIINHSVVAVKHILIRFKNTKKTESNEETETLQALEYKWNFGIKLLKKEYFYRICLLFVLWLKYYISFCVIIQKKR